VLNRAKPATTGGITIGSSTNTVIILLNGLLILARLYARGVPNKKMRRILTAVVKRLNKKGAQKVVKLLSGEDFVMRNVRQIKAIPGITNKRKNKNELKFMIDLNGNTWFSFEPRGMRERSDDFWGINTYSFVSN
jgi:hypothetical protein